MSEKFTQVRTESGAALLWPDHVSWDEGVAHLRRHLEAQLAEARAGLLDMDRGRVRVFHQRGVIVTRNQREVKP